MTEASNRFTREMNYTIISFGLYLWQQSKKRQEETKFRDDGDAWNHNYYKFQLTISSARVYEGYATLSHIFQPLTVGNNHPNIGLADLKMNLFWKKRILEQSVSGSCNNARPLCKMVQ